MALFETLSAMLTGKAAAAAATLTIVSGTAAGATGTLPQGLQTAFDNVAGVSQDDGTVEEIEPLPTDTDVDDTQEPVTDDETVDGGEEVSEEEVTEPRPEDAEDADEVEDADGRSAKAEQVLRDLGDGCMPADDDCHFGQAVAGNAREKGAEHSAKGKERAEQNRARRGPPAASHQRDEPDTTGDDTDETDTDDEARDDETDETDTDDEAPGEDGPAASSNKPDAVGR